MSGGGQDGGDFPPVPPPSDVRGPPPPQPSEEEIKHAQECNDLGREAYSAFEEARASLGVDQCAAVADCMPHAAYWANLAFSGGSDGCWATCAILPGTKDYVDALKEIGDDVCGPFGAEGCVVVPPGCPPLPVGFAPTWACIDGECFRQ